MKHPERENDNSVSIAPKSKMTGTFPYIIMACGATTLSEILLELLMP
jgi:hypothetical protein